MIRSGLFGKGGGHAVALLGVDVRAEVLAGHACAVVRQRYRNDETKAIEAVYTFPLPTKAVLTGFSMTVEGRRLEGEVHEREEAFRRYDDAITAGHGGALLELSGYAFAFDAYRNNNIGDAPVPSFSILKIDGAQAPGSYAWHVRKRGPWSYVFDSWRQTSITVANGKMSASVTGTPVFTDETIDTSSPIVAIGFTAATGGADDNLAFFIDTVSIAFTNATCN